jgi:hypothetical protein
LSPPSKPADKIKVLTTFKEKALRVIYNNLSGWHFNFGTSYMYIATRVKAKKIKPSAVTWDSTRCYSRNEIDSLKAIEDKECEQYEQESSEQ